MGHRLFNKHLSFGNHHHAHHGSIKMWQNGACIKLVGGLTFIGFLSAFYFLGDITSTGYMLILRRSVDKSPYFHYFNATVAVTKSEGYLVWSPSCRIPDVSPWHETIKKFVKGGAGSVKCGSGPALSWVERNWSQDCPGGSCHVLRIRPPRQSRCCYSLITRTDVAHPRNSAQKVDDVFAVGTCKDFNDSVTFTGEEQFAKVKCISRKGKSEKEVYANMHAFVRKTEKVAAKIENNESSAVEKLSVMLVGIDSISRLNLIRTMPKTVNHLRKNGWIEYKGYNKMDDNTFPNLMAILTGHTVSQIRKKCWNKQTDTLNECPFIWNEFSQRDYVTCYAEDEPTIGSFNYHKAGFKKTPTDYYIRPFMLAAEKFMKKKVENGLNLCLGVNSSADHILNYALEFATTFRDNPSFSLFWTNSFSHNDLNKPSSMDGRVLKFLKDLSRTGALNTTLVIFLSDHGMRFGKIRETYVGWLEERLPYLYFWVPDWYRRTYPERYKSLVSNGDRLTSPFDLHLTLRDVLGDATNGTAGCPKCQSLLDHVPWNRSCQDVGVTEHWCTCSEYKTEPPESAPVRAMVRFVLEELNTALENGSQYLNNGTKCARLELNRVLSVRSKVFAHSVGHEEYVLLFETDPNEALFEATVRHKYTFKLIDTVSRINAYGSQSKCINDSHLQKYCFCLKQ